MTSKDGKIIIPIGASVWPHEMTVAKILAKQGYIIEFIVESKIEGQTTPDILIDGIKWEIKSPQASNLKAVERNLKLARWQAPRIIFDPRRMKGIPDKAIIREIQQTLTRIKGIEKVRFVSRKGEVLDFS